MCVPIKISRSERRALRAVEQRRHDAIDAAAEREGLAASWLADEYPDTSYSTQHYVRIGLMIDTALLYRKIELPPMPKDERENLALRGWFHRGAGYNRKAAAKTMDRVAAGGAGKREMVTRADRVRRAVNAAARRLDVLAAESTQADPVTLQALTIAKKLLRR